MNKKLLLGLVVITVAITFTMCKKDSTNSTVYSSFTANGVTYSANQGTHYDTSVQTFYAATSNHDSLQMSFLTKPTMSMAFAVKNDDDTLPLTAYNCGVDCLIGAGLTHDYHSIGAAGDSVHVVIKNGKMTATFNNISAIDTTNTVKMSGTIIEN